jgi:hypothetical protein
MARATLYSPPPSQTWKLRALRTRPKPGSKRSMTSPKETQSHFVSAETGLMISSDICFREGAKNARNAQKGKEASFPALLLGSQFGLDGLDEQQCLAHVLFDALEIPCVEQCFLVIMLEPMPQATMPAPNHLRSDSSVGSTPPVGMMRVHGIGPMTLLTKSGPPTEEPGKTLMISQPSSCASPISVAEPQPGL